MDANQFLEIFIEESYEHLENLNKCLLQLEKRPKDKYLLDEIFRASHTLKGMAATMGFNRLAELTHQMENLLEEIRKQRIKTDTAMIDFLFECLDGLQGFIDSIAGHGVEGDYDATRLMDKLRDMLGSKANAYNSGAIVRIEKLGLNVHELEVLNKAGQQGFSGYEIDVRLDDRCMLKSARAFIVFNTLEKLGEIIKSVPCVEDIEDEKFDNLIKLILISKVEKDRIHTDLMGIAEIVEVKVENLSFVGGGKTKDKEQEEYDDSLNKGALVGGKNITGKTVRVDIDRLDNLMNLVSELIIIKTRLEENDTIKENANSSEALEYLERITTNLHDAVMKVRMVPIERVFNRFPRMVRDMSRDLGKEIGLNMFGEETEVDRTIIDEIGDPLIHLIRNCIDHGIEQVEERRKLGKDDAGKVVLRAYHDGNTVVIEAEDDGRGIDLHKIADKALEKGLYSKQQIEQIDSEDLIQLIFSPGFSTVNEVSDISGRGVGLDVVKTKIESLGGMVEVESKTDVGTKFIIRLPLTLAIIQALLVSVGTEDYAIPLNSIKEIVTIKSSTVKNVQNQEVIMLRGEILPLIKLDVELGIEGVQEILDEKIVVVVRKGDKLAGVIVDELIGQQEIVIKSLGKYLSGIKYLAGATILGDGRVSLILDTNSLF